MRWMDRQRDMMNVLVYLIERGCSSCPIWIRTKLFVVRDRDITHLKELHRISRRWTVFVPSRGDP